MLYAEVVMKSKLESRGNIIVEGDVDEIKP